MKIPEYIYMVGIGGIGMSALAQLLLHEGKKVSGTDRVDSPVVELLSKKGLEITIGVGSLPEDAELLIYSDAIPNSHEIREEARKRGIPELSYFEALGEVSKGKRTIAVSGTHGKTTTSGMLAKILWDAKKQPTAIVGSIVRDFGSNFLPGNDDVLVIEACEYRNHLLKLDPEILVITNIELDHTDYFPNLEALQETFRKAVQKVPAHGAIVTNPSDPVIAEVVEDSFAHLIDYTKEEVPELGLIGDFNTMNAKAAAAAARTAFSDIEQGSIDRALCDFKGSWRRFEYKGETQNGASVYDDYAHHPTAIRKTIEAVREKFPEKRIVVAFHPHLYSRTRDLFDGFVQSLAKADFTIIAPIYAAREPFDASVSNRVLAQKVNEAGGKAIALDSFDEIREELLRHDSRSLVVTMGAGDIYKIAEQIAD